MKTRITVERLIGENTPTYFLDFFDKNQMEWKAHTNHKKLHDAEKEQARLVSSQVVV